jgi:hypothetical protein
MIDYQIQPSTRRCAITGRELRPGEKFFTVLLDEGGKFVRQDYSSDAWQGPPENAFSFWMGHVPAEEGRKPLPIDDDLLLDCFVRLEESTEAGRISFRYVVALLLMRRRRLKFEEAAQEEGREILVLRCARTGQRHRVINPRLTEEESAAVQEEVFQVLGWE